MVDRINKIIIDGNFGLYPSKKGCNDKQINTNQARVELFW